MPNPNDRSDNPIGPPAPLPSKRSMITRSQTGSTPSCKRKKQAKDAEEAVKDASAPIINPNDRNDNPIGPPAPPSPEGSMITRSQTGSTPSSKRKKKASDAEEAVKEAASAPIPDDILNRCGDSNACSGSGGIASIPTWSASEEETSLAAPSEGTGEQKEEDCLLNDVDVEEYVKELRELEKKVDRSELADGTMESSTLSKGHAKRRCKSEESFIRHLGNVCECVFCDCYFCF